MLRKAGDAVTIREVAQRIGRSESALRRAIKAGELHAETIDGKYDITEEAPPMRKEGAPTRDTEELERLRMENQTLSGFLAKFIMSFQRRLESRKPRE